MTFNDSVGVTYKMLVTSQLGRHRINGPPPTQEVLAPVQAQHNRQPRYVVDPETGCWIWQGSKNPAGYGLTGIRGAYQLAHRALFMVKYGHVPAQFHCHHLCHTRACVNPDHLELLLIGEHSRLHPSVGRKKVRRSDAHLTDAQVDEIRRRVAAGEKKRPLASEYGVSRGVIYACFRRKAWQGGKSVGMEAWDGEKWADDFH